MVWGPGLCSGVTMSNTFGVGMSGAIYQPCRFRPGPWRTGKFRKDLGRPCALGSSALCRSKEPISPAAGHILPGGVGSLHREFFPMAQHWPPSHPRHYLVHLSTGARSDHDDPRRGSNEFQDRNVNGNALIHTGRRVLLPQLPPPLLLSRRRREHRRFRRSCPPATSCSLRFRASKYWRPTSCSLRVFFSSLQGAQLLRPAPDFFKEVPKMIPCPQFGLFVVWFLTRNMGLCSGVTMSRRLTVGMSKTSIKILWVGGPPALLIILGPTKPWSENQIKTKSPRSGS